MTDRIEVRGLVVTCVVGVHDHERRAPRELLLDLVLETDLRRAGATDSLADTVDYDALARIVRERFRGLAPRLIETVAAETADVCLGDRRVDAVTVTVRKTGAVEGTESVSVTVRRTR